METNNKVVKRSKRNFDTEELNKCTLCNYRSHAKGAFQRHLINLHGIKLKTLEPYDNQTVYRRGAWQRRNCSKCNKVCTTKKYYDAHVRKCSAGESLPCPKCKMAFDKLANLKKHLQFCGKERQIICQLCPHKCFTMNRMSRHYLREHNLVCRAVNEPDFDQALNCTPYILERALEVETLPTLLDVTAPVGDSVHIRLGTQPGTQAVKKRKKKAKPIFTCKICKKEFTKQRFLNRHIKRGCD